MKNNLVLVTSLAIIPKLKEKGIKYFAFPLSFFCVGTLKTFTIKEIKEENSFLFINRTLDSKSINAFKEIIINLPKNIKGIIFEDLGLIPLLKDINIEKILYNPHHLTNYKSINLYLDYVDSIIVSSDITYEEIELIVQKAQKKVSLFVFGPVEAMISRRKLLTSHAKHYNLEYVNIKKLNVSGKDFIALENEFGTSLYYMPIYNGLRLKKLDAKYYFYFPVLMEEKDILDLMDGKVNISSSEGFLDTKTIYKVKNR